jgi:hypothetical protein
MFEKANSFGVRGRWRKLQLNPRRFFGFFLGPGGMELTYLSAPPPAA